MHLGNVGYFLKMKIFSPKLTFYLAKLQIGQPDDEIVDRDNCDSPSILSCPVVEDNRSQSINRPNATGTIRA